MGTEPRYAVVEIMGHTRRAGAISEVTFCGAPMLRIEHTSWMHNDERLAVMYSPAAIFSVTPCSFDDAVTSNVWGWRDPTLSTLELEQSQRTFICPTDQEGCGHEFTAVDTDHDINCPQCGLWFDPDMDDHMRDGF